MLIRKLLLKSVTLIIFCLFFADTGSAKDVTLPKLTGIYTVGTKAFELKDEARKMLQDKTPRRWMIQAFYLSNEQHRLYPYMPETLDNGTVRWVYVLTYANPDTNILKSERIYPVIIFIPGLGHSRQDYTILCEDLASHGYIILSLDQPYVSNFVKFPDGTKIVLTFKDVWKLTLRGDRDYRYQYYDKAMRAAIGDIKYMLDHLDKINKTYFSGHLNTKNITLMGHSFGGNVAHTLGFEDSRIKAVIDIDSKITERKIYGRIGVPPNPQGKPVFFIRGMMQYQDDVGDQLTKVQNADIWQPYVQHNAFCDFPYLVNHIPEIEQTSPFSLLWNWFSKKGPVFSAVDTGLGEQDVDQWFNEYREKVISWLDHQVKK